MLHLTARPATLVDAAWLRRLRNDPGTVAASVVAQPVTEAEHARWVAMTLNNPDHALMVVEEAGVAVATYRLDEIGSAAIEVSLTVAPEVRGRGLATLVIRLAAEHAMREGPDAVLAVIRADNMRSLRAFVRAGFGNQVTTRFLRVTLPATPGTFALCSVVPMTVAGWSCAACARGVPHHTNSLTSIGRAGNRYPIYDIHEEPDGFYGFTTYECDAGDLWLAWEKSRRKRLGESEPDYSVRTTVLKEEGR